MTPEEIWGHVGLVILALMFVSFFFYMGPGYVMHQKWLEKRRKRIIVGDLNVQKWKKERDRKQKAKQSSTGACRCSCESTIFKI